MSNQGFIFGPIFKIDFNREETKNEMTKMDFILKEEKMIILIIIGVLIAILLVIILFILIRNRSFIFLLRSTVVHDGTSPIDSP